MSLITYRCFLARHFIHVINIIHRGLCKNYPLLARSFMHRKKVEFIRFFSLMHRWREFVDNLSRLYGVFLRYPFSARHNRLVAGRDISLGSRINNVFMDGGAAEPLSFDNNAHYRFPVSILSRR